MSTITAWEPGTLCEGCGGEFQLGEDVIYWYGKKMHLSCASSDAASRRKAAGEDGDVLAVARAQAEAGGRVILTRKQLRELAHLVVDAGVEPVHRPDSGRQKWYGRLVGWSADRVEAGLSAAEVAGMWLDFLEGGRMPPVRQRDLTAILAAIQGGEVDAGILAE